MYFSAFRSKKHPPFTGISMQKNEEQPKSNHVAIMFFGMFFGPGMLTFFISIILFIVTFPSNYWPSVPGIITSSRYTERGGSVTPSDTRYYVRIRYDYRVLGKKYTGNRWSVVESSSRYRKDAQKLHEQYPVGTSVTVYYYPKSPEKSAINPGVPPVVYNWFFSGLGLMLFGAIGLGFVTGLFKSYFKPSS